MTNAATPVGGREISLQGWDTVNVVTTDVINAAITKDHTTPPTFKGQDSFAGSIDGVWGTWQMIPDPATSGGGVKMQCPVASGTGVDAKGMTNDLAGTVVVVTLTLANQPTTVVVKDKTAAVPDAPKAAVQALAVDPAPGTPGSKAVVDKVTPPAMSQRFLSLFQDWFDDHIGEFGQVFIAMLINSKAAQGKFQWLKPTELSYASATTLGGAGYFGALCQTLDHPWAQNAQQFDVAIGENIPTGSNSVLAISGESFATQILLPGAAAMFAGSGTGDFSLDSTGLIVTNNKELTWQDMKLDDGTQVTAIVPSGQFSIQVVGDQIEVQFTGVTWQHPLLVGNDVFSLNFTQRIHLALGKNAAGQQVLIASNKNPAVAGATEAPDIRSCTISVTPDAAAVDFDRIMSIIGMVTAVIGIGVFALGKWAVSAAQTAAAAAELRTALASGAAALDVAVDAAGAARSMSSLEVVQGNLAAAEAFANQGAPISAAGALFIGRIGVAMAVLGAVSTVAVNMNKLMILADGSIDRDKVPAVDEFLDNVLGVAAWPGVQGWTLNDMELAKSLLLYGKATF